jgi:rhamnogalacturonyl hydrolase YesR/O-antigen/teichoic acid export membrane protein
MGRIENAIRNIFFGTIGNLFTVVLGFVSRTIFIRTLGITYLGVNGLYSNILSVLSLAELGIGTAMNYSLYQPVANKDYNKIKSLMNLYKLVYRIIGVVIGVIGLLLIPMLKYMVKDPGDLTVGDLTIYYLIFLFNTVSTYFITYKYSLANAEQKNYIQTNIQSITLFVTLMVQIIVLIMYHNFLIYLLVGSMVGIIQKVGVYFYFNKRYPYLLDKNVDELSAKDKKEFKKNVIALLYHKIGDISINQTDNILISVFINITAVGFLSNYNLIIMTVMGFINIIFYSVISGLGNLVATESKERQYLLFRVYRFMAFWLYGLAILFLAFLLTPFITFWLGKDMVVSKVVIAFIMIDYYMKAHRTVLNNFKAAAGIFDADKYITILQGAANLVISILLVKLIGLKGIFLGTIISGLIANIAKPYIIYKIKFQKTVIHYFKESFLYINIIGMAYFVLYSVQHLLVDITTKVGFSMMFVAILFISNIIFYLTLHRREEFVYLKQIIATRYHINFNLWYRQIAKNEKVNKNKMLEDETTLTQDSHEINQLKLNKINEANHIDVLNQYEELNQLVELRQFTELRMYTREQMMNYPVYTKKGWIHFVIKHLVTTRKLPTIDRFFWPNGLLAISLECSYMTLKDKKDLECLIRYYDKWIHEGMKFSNLDNAVSGYSFIYIHQVTKDAKYKEGVDKLLAYIYEAPTDKKGSIAYRKSRPNDIYVDSMGMIVPFLCRYGKTYKDNKALDLGVGQIVNYIKYGLDSNSYLPYHGYNLEERIKYGIIGWGRGVGWLLIGMVDSLEYISDHMSYPFIVAEFKRIVNECIKYQLESGYFTWQLTALEGPIDTSATSMILYAIKKGIMLGVLNKDYTKYSELGILALRKMIHEGKVMSSSGECMGFSMYPQTYGEYPWAQGPTTALIALHMSK